MTRLSRWSKICLACSAVFSIITGFLEQRQMEEQIRETVAEILSEQEEEV